MITRNSVEIRELVEKLLFHKDNKSSMTLYPEGSDMEIIIDCLIDEAKEAENREEMEREHAEEEQAEELRQKEADEEEENKMRNDMVNDEKPEEEV